MASDLMSELKLRPTNHRQNSDEEPTRPKDHQIKRCKSGKHIEMKITVEIPSALRRFTDGVQTIEREIVAHG